MKAWSRREEFNRFGDIVGTRDGRTVGWGYAAVVPEGVECDDRMGNVRECAPVSTTAEAK